MIKNVIFDLDGTLADTQEIILRSFKHIHKKFNNTAPGNKEILKTFGEPLRDTLKSQFRQDVDLVIGEYRKFHQDIFHQYLNPHEGAIEIVKKLKDDNYTLGIVTSRLGESAIDILETFDIKKYFSTIVTVEDTEKNKPNPEPLLKALSQINAKADESIYIGDTKFDIECAKNAKVTSVLVGWSHYKVEENDVKPDYMIDDFSELENIIKMHN